MPLRVTGLTIEEPLKEQAAVRVENVSKKFGRFDAIRDVSFEISKGEVVGFLGPNGAGKTTTMRILAGFFPPTSGKVWISGADLSENPQRSKKKIGYLPESVSIYPDMKVEPFLKFAAKLKGVSGRDLKSHVQERMERCGLTEVRSRIIGQLSKGFRQRVGLAQAILADPDLIILDEPTNGLDPKQIIEIRHLIKELAAERTLLLSSHILPEVSMVCSRILIMNKGKIVASGTSEELEAGLKRAKEIYVIIAGTRYKDLAFDLLSKLPGVEKVSPVEAREDQTGFSITCGREEDLRPEISRVFVQHQIPLLELRSGRLSLEDIFMKIVLNEDRPHGTEPE